MENKHFLSRFISLFICQEVASDYNSCPEMPPVRRRQRFTQLSEFDRGRIVGLREGNMSFREIARHVGRNQATVFRCWQAWVEQQRTRRSGGTGRRRLTTERQERRLRLMALRDRLSSTRTIAGQWFADVGRPISMRSVYTRIRSFGLRSYRPHLVLPLTAEHRRQRLLWCRERQNWDAEWNSLIFSDESRFTLGMHDGRMMVRRRRGERRHMQYAVERHVHRVVGVMVWGAIAYDSRSPLVFIHGNMTARRYIQEVVEPHLLPYLRGHLEPIFKQDNARPHIARVALDFFEESQVTLLPWPPRSPDLSPIEHVWDMMGRRLRTLVRQPQTLDALRHELQVAWDELPQEDLNHLIRTMPRRLNECINQRGGPTHY